MSTTLAYDFDHRGQPGSAIVSSAGGKGNRFVLSKNATVESLRFVNGSAGSNAFVRIWRVTDLVVMVTSGAVPVQNGLQYQQVSVTPTLLLAGVEYVVGSYGGSPSSVALGSTQTQHTHGPVTWLSSQQTADNTGAYPATTGPVDAEPLVGMVLTTNDAPIAPGTPTVSPTTVSAAATISWAAASDPDGDALVYDVELSTNNGASWSAIATGVGGLSTVYDFTAQPATTTARVRVRARDTSAAVGPYATSLLFTIQHNAAPTAPAGLSPSGGQSVERLQTQRLSWLFFDPDAGDTQSKWDVQWQPSGGSFTTVTQTTPQTFWDAPAATFPAGSIEWRVRTYDAQGEVSPWSSSAFFTAAVSPGLPIITAPTNGQVIASSAGVVTWSAPLQEAYQVRTVADLTGAADPTTVYSDTGTVISSTDRDRALTFPVNNRFEHVQVRIRNSGLWSGWASVRVEVSFTPPGTPSVGVDGRTDLAAIVITPAMPTAGPGEPALAYLDLYRRETAVGGLGTRLATMQPLAPWTDYTPASGVDYEYRATAFGVNGTQAEGPWQGLLAADYELSLFDQSVYA